MAISRELVSGFQRLQEMFYAEPSAAWAPWIAVSESCGQTMITIINSMLERRYRGESEIVVLKTYDSHIGLTAVANTPPWSELIVLDDVQGQLQILSTVEKSDLESLLAIWMKNSSAIE